MISCYCCHSDNVKYLGEIENIQSVGQEKAIISRRSLFSLFLCNVCKLQFKHPKPDNIDLQAHYNINDIAEYCDDPLFRKDWAIIQLELKKRKGGDVLDVGCNSGSFLTMLDRDNCLFGIESSFMAKEAAESKGVVILGSDINVIDLPHERFDVITLIDVFEHMIHPYDILEKLIRSLRQNGVLIISTGNTNALSWRLSGLYYYYSRLPEHFIFANRDWFKWIEKNINCRIKRIYFSSRVYSSVKQKLFEAILNIVYIFYHRVVKLRPFKFFKAIPLASRIAYWQECWWTSSKDHIIIILEKR